MPYFILRIFIYVLYSLSQNTDATCHWTIVLNMHNHNIKIALFNSNFCMTSYMIYDKLNNVDTVLTKAEYAHKNLIVFHIKFFHSTFSFTSLARNKLGLKEDSIFLFKSSYTYFCWMYKTHHYKQHFSNYHLHQHIKEKHQELTCSATEGFIIHG